MMKKYSFLFMALLPVLFSSCLKYGLEEGELSIECDVTNVRFEHRWAIENSSNGMAELRFREMSVARTIDKDQSSIEVTITVPAANATYPDDQRAATVLSNLACSFEVSRAASVQPMNGAPKLGAPGDYTQERTYRVTSASGQYKDWTLKVVEFKK
jgi:hypothetical protein